MRRKGKSNIKNDVKFLRRHDTKRGTRNRLEKRNSSSMEVSTENGYKRSRYGYLVTENKRDAT